MRSPAGRFAVNWLLANLSVDSLAILEPHLEFTPLQVGRVLVHPSRLIEHAYFPGEGVASVLAHAGPDIRLEVGLFGRDGMSASSLLLGADQTPEETIVQISGSGFRIEGRNLLMAVSQSVPLHQSLLKFAHLMALQTAYTAVANGTRSIEARLARWLLMCHDRGDNDEIPLTHEFLALMLAVRRSGVTLAIQTLEGKGLIMARRGCITIRRRGGLEALAGENYGPPEAEYARMIRPLRRG